MHVNSIAADFKARAASNLARRGFLAAIAAAILVGCFLRVTQIGDQFVIDDEMHAIRAMEDYSAWHVYTHFFQSDICIPQTLFLKVLARRAPLNETTARALSLGFGVALMFFPFFSRGLADRRSLALLTAFVALHPLLVLYSRYARPYVVVIALATASLFCFYRHCVTRKARFLNAYAFLAALSIYFHLLSAPTVCAPFVLMALSNWNGGFPMGMTFRPRDVLAAAAILCAMLAVTIAPPLFFDHATLLRKSARAALDGDSFYYSALMLLGVKSAWMGALVLAVAVFGLWRLLRDNRALGCVVAVPFALQVGFLLALRPDALDVPDVFARYAFWTLPLLMLTATSGLRAMQAIASRRFPALRGIDLLVAGLWIAVNPTWDFVYAHDNFMIPYMYQRALMDPPRFVPRIYSLLAVTPVQGAVAEAPWLYFKDLTPWPDYQKVHRRNDYALLLSDVSPSTFRLAVDLNELGVASPKVRFKKFITLKDAGENAEILFLIFHVKPLQEYGALAYVPSIDMNEVRARIDPKTWRLACRDEFVEVYAKRSAGPIP